MGARALARRLDPQRGSSIKEPAWKTKPSWSVVATDDHELSLHVIFISHPKEVSAVILRRLAKHCDLIFQTILIFILN
jgi:hypothetical protein